MTGNVQCGASVKVVFNYHTDNYWHYYSLHYDNVTNTRLQGYNFPVTAPSCVKLERWQGPPHINKVKQYEIVLSFKVSLFIQLFELGEFDFSLTC